MSVVKLYHNPSSGPSRGALLSARAIGVPVEIEIVDLYQKEQLNESFVKMNPQHCVPTLDDDGFILWESKAIASYLSDKYGHDDQWYPKDFKHRSLVNQRLYFDASNLYVKFRAVCYSIVLHGKTEVEKFQKDDLNGALSILDKFLSESKWLAGDLPTIADTCIYASVSNILAIGWDITSFPNIQRWVKECKDSIPGAAENDEGAKTFGEAIRTSQNKNQSSKEAN